MPQNQVVNSLVLISLAEISAFGLPSFRQDLVTIFLLRALFLKCSLAITQIKDSQFLLSNL